LLVQQGLCTQAKRDALLAWPAWITPSMPGITWPATLLHASLLAQPTMFSAIQRGISHVKIAWRGAASPSAKAYFGFRPEWIQFIAASSPLERRPSSAEQSASREFPSRDAAGAAIDRAIAFLLNARQSDDWWIDFPELWTGSDEWVTAFAGAALAGIPNGRARGAAERAWSLLLGRRSNTGWGYHAAAPIDMDSTTWGLRLAYAIGAEDSLRAQRARDAVDACALPDGGLPCYPRGVLRHLFPFFGDAFDGPHAGWCLTSHVCVTAAAAVLPDERARDFLRRGQRENGSWPAYWWEDAAYSTSLAVEALARTTRREDRVLVDAAVEWALGRVRPGGDVRSGNQSGGSPFITACCVLILVHALESARVRPTLDRAVRWLTETQQSDGSWKASAHLRVPPPEVIDPDSRPEPPAVFLDERRFFTTARVVAALAAARALVDAQGIGADSVDSMMEL
jgi:hypothetical protein